MNAILLSIGDELASGLTVDTNSAWLAQQLAAIGIRAIAHITVGDHLESIATAIRQACDQLDLEPSLGNPGGVLLITGGLGPTEDDLTRQAVADALNQQLVEDPDAMLQIEHFFKSINRPMSPSNRLQALRPHEATILENTAGTAPGLWAKKNHTKIFVMPGVPREMKEMFTRAVLPLLNEHLSEFAPDPIITQVAKINTFGLGESLIGEKIKDFMTRKQFPVSSLQSPDQILDTRNPKLETSVGTTVHDGIVSVRIYATGTRPQTTETIAKIRQTLHDRLGPLIFGENEDALEASVAALLTRNKFTLATAESCTGGLLAALLTNTPGASAYFQRGWVTYANAAKHEDLAVPTALLEEHGAVSEPVARAMAEAARKFAHANFALSTTGIAGPDGGTPEKPVGTVWIALASAAGVDARHFIFPGTRPQIRLRAAQMALALLRWKLLGMAPPI